MLTFPRASSFVLALILAAAAPAAVVTRGPYLQLASDNSITIRWRTDLGTDSVVRYGTSPDELMRTARDPRPATEHEVTLHGLEPATRYTYSIGSGAETLAGGDAQFTFVTAPRPGTPAPTRIWALGDSGTGGWDAERVRDAYLAFAGDATNVWLMLGDNAYESGRDDEYQAALFDMYATLLRQTPLWPALGNHDTAESAAPPANLPYFQIFTLPEHGEAGGLPSHTEKYYSFDHANIHFVCLDSMTSSRTPGSPMLTWLEQDLVVNRQPWVIAFWHHPPYSKGGHDSDVDWELKEMRENVLPILETYGVDLVLTGHSHSYERSWLLDGHYGKSPTFVESMKRDAGDGRATPFHKRAGAHQGTVYAVAGTGAMVGGGTLDHPAMAVSQRELGSLVIDVDGDRLDVRFLHADGTIGDAFAIVKDASSPGRMGRRRSVGHR
jgi:hypothetical protein